MNKISKILIISSVAIVTVSFASQKYLSFAPVKGFAHSEPGMVHFTIQGQVAKEMFERLVPSVAHDKTDRVCAKGETKVNKFVVCDVDKNQTYECKFTVLLDDKTSYTYLDDPAVPYECEADPTIKNYEPAQKEAKKNGYWQQN